MTFSQEKSENNALKNFYAHNEQSLYQNRTFPNFITSHLID